MANSTRTTKAALPKILFYSIAIEGAYFFLAWLFQQTFTVPEINTSIKTIQAVYQLTGNGIVPLFLVNAGIFSVSFLMSILALGAFYRIRKESFDSTKLLAFFFFKSLSIPFSLLILITSLLVLCLAQYQIIWLISAFLGWFLSNGYALKTAFLAILGYHGYTEIFALSFPLATFCTLFNKKLDELAVFDSIALKVFLLGLVILFVSAFLEIQFTPLLVESICGSLPMR
jgi:hypothetical protein